MANIVRRETSGDGNEFINDANGTIVDPAAIDASGSGTGDSGGNDQPRRRRGRPPGSGGGTRSASAKVRAVPVEPAAISAALIGIHSLLAGIASAPELELSQAEGDALGTGVANVARHYEFLSGVGQKWVDVYNLGIIAGTIYAGKFMAMRSRGRVQPDPSGSRGETVGGLNGTRGASGGTVTALTGADLFPVEVPGDPIIH